MEYAWEYITINSLDGMPDYFMGYASIDETFANNLLNSLCLLVLNNKNVVVTHAIVLCRRRLKMDTTCYLWMRS